MLGQVVRPDWKRMGERAGLGDSKLGHDKEAAKGDSHMSKGHHMLARRRPSHATHASLAIPSPVFHCLPALPNERKKTPTTAAAAAAAFTCYAVQCHVAPINYTLASPVCPPCSVAPLPSSQGRANLCCSHVSTSGTGASPVAAGHLLPSLATASLPSRQTYPGAKRLLIIATCAHDISCHVRSLLLSVGCLRPSAHP